MSYSTVSSKLFTWTRRTGVAEISCLGKDFRIGRIWPDSCDEGFEVVSSRTGKRLKFVLYSVTEGDTRIWRFLAHDGTRSVFPPIEVCIAND